MIELVLATANLHKVREFRDFFRTLPQFELLSLSHFPSYSQPEESGKTFQENAIIKATHAAKALGKWVLADDSGLVVPAIGGKPGILSRRFAGDTASDADNRKKLLECLQSLQEHERAAVFECSLALASPEKLVKTVIATCEGTIALEERGRDGFGYDALFIKVDYDKTLAELGEALKNRVSHRRKAFEKITHTLESLF